MLTSPDPRIQALINRRETLRCDLVRASGEAVRVETVLTAYAQVAPRRGETAHMPVVAPLRHYTMLDGHACACDVCREWRDREAELMAAMKFVPAGHRWSICGCPDCRFVGRMQLNYLAASNVRDLLIEMSYHATYHSRHGEKVMAWFAEEIVKPCYTVMWCAYELGRQPVEDWLKRCEAAVSGVASGRVFVASEGQRDDFEPGGMASQIGDACAYAPMVAA